MGAFERSAQELERLGRSVHKQSVAVKRSRNTLRERAKECDTLRKEANALAQRAERARAELAAERDRELAAVETRLRMEEAELKARYSEEHSVLHNLFNSEKARLEGVEYQTAVERTMNRKQLQVFFFSRQHTATHAHPYYPPTRLRSSFSLS